MFRRKWPPASKVYLMLAVASGIVAFTLTNGYARRLEAQHPQIGDPIPVVVTTADVARGGTLSASELEVRRMPSSFAPPGAFGRIDDVAGRATVADLAAGEAITRTRVSAPGAGPVAALVPPGLVAVSIGAGVPRGTVRRGDRVAVLATYGGGHPHTETVASDLEVLMVLDPVSSGGPAPSTGQAASTQLVLLVSPDVAESLAYAMAFGTIAVAIDAAPSSDPSV
jgi:Flp pilus assembly protein CpaB